MFLFWNYLAECPYFFKFNFNKIEFCIKLNILKIKLYVNF